MDISCSSYDNYKASEILEIITVLCMCNFQFSIITLTGFQISACSYIKVTSLKFIIVKIITYFVMTGFVLRQALQLRMLLAVHVDCVI